MLPQYRKTQWYYTVIWQMDFQITYYELHLEESFKRSFPCGFQKFKARRF